MTGKGTMTIGSGVAGSVVTITATDGFNTEAYFTAHHQPGKLGVICIMEAFGINEHIQRVADDYAKAGYTVLAPALYDRIERGLTFDYDTQLQDAIDAMVSNGFDNPLHDVAGCVDYFKQLGIERIGIVGFCYGGAVSWLAASRNPDINAASCYYGTAIVNFADDHPQCPTIANWGKTDPTTREEDIAVVAAANPHVSMYWYDAGHGFNSDNRPISYDAAAAELARERTLAFFQQHL